MASFYTGKRVFITGHTGFKGSWLSLWLTQMGAVVTGYSLPPPTNPSLFELSNVGSFVLSHIADVRDCEQLTNALSHSKPEIVFHLAGQSLVRDSYKNPVETYSTNVMGTINVLETVRRCPSVRAVVVVTTDKCYENKEWLWGYRENDRLGGFDPYSNSKACAELVTAAYRTSYFNRQTYDQHGVAIATARSGNVIGGGDWAADRLVPDVIRSVLAGEIVRIRNPHAVRPWQHVLEPLSGYLSLAQHLYEYGPDFAEAWNFGPKDEDAKPVEWVVQRLCQIGGGAARYEIDDSDHPHEAHYLKLDCSKSISKLGWKPKWNLDKALQSTMEWVVAYRENCEIQNICMQQIQAYNFST